MGGMAAPASRATLVAGAGERAVASWRGSGGGGRKGEDDTESLGGEVQTMKAWQVWLSSQQQSSLVFR